MSDDTSGALEAKLGEPDKTTKDDWDNGHPGSGFDDPEAGVQDALQHIQTLMTYLSSVQEDGEELAAGFQRIPNRRMLPDYFDVISNPIAFSTIRLNQSKIQKKQYSAFSEFVKDIAQICHNAQVYNRPTAPIFNAAVRLREVFCVELKKLAEKGIISSDDARLPDLGDLPPVEESSSPRSGDGDGGDADDDDDDADDDDEGEGEVEREDDDDDSTDGDDGHRKRTNRLGRRHKALTGRKEQDDEPDEDTYKRRGRPPMIQTPMEARISSILRGLRRFKDGEGNPIVLPFEKLPDKVAMADYYSVIHNPIALDTIKKKAKRKKYHNVDELQKDIELMLENARVYNEDDSVVYRAALELQTQSRILLEQERAKPDDDFRDEDGKLALSEVQHDGQMWRVGDWVHIRNPNDLAKPIVAQIFRTWQDRAGQQWINACWYYRPEQTVHRYDKHFFEHEVVKTGQYRDHQTSELLDRCFVMFVTRFSKGRPRGFPTDKEVYVCESRYNEENFRFNKIKTWASCVPDEVRDKDYEMDLFDAPHRVKKVPSPIKHLLREDAKASDELPRPTWGSPNAPPIVGAVHRRPPESNESPPPELTPPPSSSVQPLMDRTSEPIPRHSTSSLTSDMQMDCIAKQPGFVVNSPRPSPNPARCSVTSIGQFGPATSGLLGHHMQQTTPVPIPQPSQALSNSQASLRPIQYQQQQQAGYASNKAPTYSQPNASYIHNQSMTSQAAAQYNQHHVHTRTLPTANGIAATNIYNPPRPPEVYTLLNSANDTLHENIRGAYQHDSAGRVLFFAGPPLNRPVKRVSPQDEEFGHSVKYLSGRNGWMADREKKRRRKTSQGALARPASRGSEITKDASIAGATTAMNEWLTAFDEGAGRWQRKVGLEGWRIPANA
ncbi:hypothetical protein E4U53_001652 [Claviceps sorghi]|nr:hypothetical protein E4U53_001652 [Claviceps sorghi]